MSALVGLSSANAKNLDYFKDRFKIVTNDDGEKVIIDSKIKENLDIENYIKNLGNYFGLKKAERRAYLSYQCAAREYDKPKKEEKLFDLPFTIAQRSDIIKRLTQFSTSDRAKSIRDEVQKRLIDNEYPVLVNLNNPKYFAKYRLKDALIKKLLDEVISLLDIGTAVRVFKLVRDSYYNHIYNKKKFSQHMLFYYLTQHSAEDLGLTESQKNRALSSFYESQLYSANVSLKDLIKRSAKINAKKLKKEIKQGQVDKENLIDSISEEIADDFENYGRLEFQRVLGNIGRRNGWLRDNTDLNPGNRILLPFAARVSYNSGEFIIDTLKPKYYLRTNVKEADNQSVLVEKTMPSVVYDADCPTYNYEARRAKRSAQVALRLNPIPLRDKWAKYVNKIWYKNLNYDSNVDSEAIIYARMVDHGKMEIAETILRQSMNPLLTR